MCFDDPRLVLFGENQWAVAAFFSQKIIQTEEILQRTLWFNRASWSCKVQNGDGWDENFRVWGFVFFLMYFRDVGSGWVGTNAWCKMENLSGIVQNGDVWDENLRVWGFVFFLMYFCDVGSGWVGTNAWCKMENLSGKVQNGDVWDENLRVWGFVFIFKCIFVMLVQDGLAPIFNIICFTIFTHGAKRDQTVSHSFCWCRIGLKMFDLKKHKMRNLRTRLTILYWLFHALGTFIELRALRALGPGSWGRRKGCFCSASGFLL